MSDDPNRVQQQNSEEPVRLDYLPPHEDRERAERESTRAFFGSVLGFVISIIVAASWVLSRIPEPMPMGLKVPPSNRGPLITTFIAIAFLGGIALFQYRRDHSSGFGKGALLGLGAGSLALAGMSLMAKGC